jgi:hypothetical protein
MPDSSTPPDSEPPGNVPSPPDEVPSETAIANKLQASIAELVKRSQDLRASGDRLAEEADRLRQLSSRKIAPPPPDKGK